MMNFFVLCTGGSDGGRKMTVPSKERIEKLVFPGENGKVTSSCAPPFPPLTPFKSHFRALRNGLVPSLPPPVA